MLIARIQRVLNSRSLEGYKRLKSDFVGSFKNPQVQNEIAKFEKDLLKPLQYEQKNSVGACVAFMKGFNEWLKVPDDKFAELCLITNKYEDSIFLLDDIIDNAEFRKDRPTTFKTFGLTSTAICYALSLAEVQKTVMETANYNPKITELMLDCLITIYRAEGYDHLWHENFYCPNEAELAANMVRRNANVMKFCVGLMKLWSENKSDFDCLIELFAVFFQLFNDYENIFMAENYYENEKEFASDLDKGKFTLAVSHAIRVGKNQEFIGKREKGDKFVIL
jgi:geranylgeranyl diphosphate synthase, type III